MELDPPVTFVLQPTISNQSVPLASSLGHGNTMNGKIIATLTNKEKEGGIQLRMSMRERRRRKEKLVKEQKNFGAVFNLEVWS